MIFNDEYAKGFKEGLEEVRGREYGAWGWTYMSASIEAFRWKFIGEWTKILWKYFFHKILNSRINWFQRKRGKTNRKKEEDIMTRIGQMIFNDGYAKGFKEGLAEVRDREYGARGWTYMSASIEAFRWKSFGWPVENNRRWWIYGTIDARVQYYEKSIFTRF